MSSLQNAPTVKRDLRYEVAMFLWRTVMNIFFREIRPRGAFHIPRDGPVIFTVAPHHNQACTSPPGNSLRTLTVFKTVR